MRILCVTNMYPCAETPARGAFVWQQVEGLRRLGHFVRVLHIRGDKSKLSYISVAINAFFQTLRGHFDLVHAHYGLSGISTLFRVHTPLVVTLHGSDILVGTLQPLISRLVCKLADGVIIVSSKMASKVRGHIIPCGVDLDVFMPHSKIDSRRRVGIALDRLWILFPFDPRRKMKRFDIARDAVELLKSRGYNIELLVVHDIQNAEMPWYYCASDAMILCSDSEGSPTAVKEALACNLPVISVDVGDVSDIMRGVKGATIVRRDSTCIANAIENVICNGAESCNGREAMRRYDQHRTVESIVEVYESVIRRKSPTEKRCACQHEKVDFNQTGFPSHHGNVIDKSQKI